ncbi:hypothetical protein K8R30_04105 [archaeon]|nr:hypothetical protein [archaeon]
MRKSDIVDVSFVNPNNRINKRAQFFLLAAVIISSVVISLGMTGNRAIVNEEPEDIYSFGYEVKKEAGAILNYGVYTNFSEGVNLSEFVDSLAEEIEERSPGSDFIFIYGTRGNMTLKNYGSESIYMDRIEIKGRKGVTSRICLNHLCQYVDENITNFADINTTTAPIDPTRTTSDDVLVEIEGNEYTFPLTDYRQVIFVLQKEVGGDRYIIVE